MKKILVIDDSLRTRLKIATNLQSGDYEVLEAASGQEGVEAIQNKHPDLVIVDLTIPIMDGLEVLEWLVNKYKPHHKLIKVLAMNGDDETAEAKARAAGCDAFLRKPFNDSDLKAFVDLLLTTP